MKFYVAGKYAERQSVSLVMSELKKIGHEITVDWTNHDIYPNDDVAQRLGSFAQDDIWGVQNCDALILCLLNDHEYKGLWVEMGVALGCNKPVYAVGNAGDSCIFLNHQSVKKFTSFPQFYQWLEGME